MSMWNREMEAQSRAALEALQEKRLAKALRRAENGPVDPSRLAEFHFDYSDPEAPKACPSTRADLLATAECVARALAAAGFEEGDPFLVAEPTGLSPDGFAFYQGCRKFGLCCIPAGGEDSALQMRLVAERRVKGVFASVDTFRRLASVKGARSHKSLRVGFVPAGGLKASVRREIEKSLGIELFACWGLPATGGAATIACECSKHAGLHVWEDLYIVDVVDRKGASVPDARTGEIVLTTLGREASPLIRVRTGVHGRILSRDKCACGRTSLRLDLAR